jgi:site-specific recombinase XerD
MASRRSSGEGTLYRINPDGVWIASWHDHTGKRRKKSTRTTDKAAARRILAKLVADAALRREGVIDPTQDAYAQAAAQDIMQFVGLFIKDLSAKGNTTQYCQETHRSIRIILDEASIDTISQLTPAAVRQVIVELKSEGKSNRTCNRHMTAIKGFAAWLWREGYTPDHRLRSLIGYNIDQDQRHVRRNPTDEELTWLIATTRTRDLENGMSGADRAMLYLLAVSTGYRRSELRSLRPESFRLDDEPPVIVVGAAYTKAGRNDAQPIPSDVAQQLREWLVGKPPQTPVFPDLPVNTARTLRWDMKAARQQWLESVPEGEERTKRESSDFLKPTDRDGKVLDFHALRGAYISRVVRSGANVKVLQSLARHADPRLTLKRYAQAHREDEVRAVEGLPSFTGKNPAEDAGEGGGSSVCQSEGNSGANDDDAVRRRAMQRRNRDR